MKKKQEETYQLTFKGFITLKMDMNEEATDHFLDALELYLRRADQNAVILNTKTGGFDTAKVKMIDYIKTEREKYKKERTNA